jgi:hypothetical protein
MRERGTAERVAGQSLRRRRLQRDVLREVMLSASECETWLTLEELAQMTGYPPASISAQLRHLRKPQHGGYRIAKRCRASERMPMSCVDDRLTHGPVWEYRLDRFCRGIYSPTARNGALHAAAVR